MMIILFALVAFFVFRWLVNLFSKIAVLSLFKKGNVQVAGLRGSGKDLLFSFVVNARKKPYISNVNYTPGNKRIKYYPLDFSQLDVNNTWSDLLSGNVKQYEFPYPDGTDVYISDAGVYLPSWDCNRVQKVFPSFPLYMALSRHLGENNIHTNAQAILRPWDKIREQGDVYILCRKSRVWFGRFAKIKLTVYSKVESCAAHVRPFPVMFGKDAKMSRVNYMASYGRIQDFTIRFILPKKAYDTRIFKQILKDGEKQC